MSDVKVQLKIQERDLTLYRFPKRPNETLQAWDAGDEYLIKHIEELPLKADQNILIMNDSFGALSCWFSEKHNVTMMSDSYISHQATLKNLQRNKCNHIQFIDCLNDIPANTDLVIMKLPKSNRLLTWQLVKIKDLMPENTTVIAVNKAKDIHSSTLKLFDRFLGDTTTSLAWKKHRLVFSSVSVNRYETVEPITEWQVDGENYTLKNYANVYSAESLDLGARFMLQHIPSDPELSHIIDLGCGNGVLSVKAGQLNPQAKITCVDESFMALESARLNTEAALGKERDFHYIANNCLDDFEHNSASLILCNPPFHQSNTITDHIAWQMFCDAKQVLKTGGQLLVIGNRHLGYDNKLSRLFGQNKVKRIASNSKFVILQATK